MRFPYPVLTQSVTIAYTLRYCYSLWNARTKSAGGQFRRLQKVPKINWLSYQRPLGDHKTNVSLIIPIHMSTDSENLVQIGPLLSEIFGRICQFLPYHSKY